MLHNPFHHSEGSAEKPLKGSCCSKIAGEVDWENFIQWFVGFLDASLPSKHLGLIQKRFYTKKVEFLIYIRHGSMPLLRTIVIPYMHPSMLYKIENSKTYCPTKRGAQAPTTKELSLLDLHKRLYSTACFQGSRPGVCFASSTTNTFTPSTLHPFWVTGYTDVEGSFIIRVKNQRGTGWCASAIFSIHLHIKDLHLLEKIQSFLKVGRIYPEKKKCKFFGKQVWGYS